LVTVFGGDAEGFAIKAIGKSNPIGAGANAGVVAGCGAAQVRQCIGRGSWLALLGKNRKAGQQCRCQRCQA
jgi:hypothetical protein